MFLFFFNDTATTEIYTLSLHDALPIFELAPPRSQHGGERFVDLEQVDVVDCHPVAVQKLAGRRDRAGEHDHGVRSEEHTSELQSRQYLVCRLLLEKKTTHTVHPFLYLF